MAKLQRGCCANPKCQTKDPRTGQCLSEPGAVTRENEKGMDWAHQKRAEKASEVVFEPRVPMSPR